LIYALNVQQKIETQMPGTLSRGTIRIFLFTHALIGSDLANGVVANP